MSDTTVTTEAPPTTTEVTTGNDPALRTADGTIKDQTQTTTPTETKPAETTETKTDDKKPVEGGAPEKYADFTIPEGRTINKELIGEATTLFKELNLPQDAAQKLMDFATKNQIATEQSNQAAYNTMREGWRNEVLKDTSLSTGTDLKPEVSQGIGRAIDSLGAELAPKFREVMNTTGVGDNPTFVKAMFELSKFVTEGRPVSGKGPSPAGQTSPDAKPKSVASAMFPNLK